MHRRMSTDVRPSEITPEALYLRRREFVLAGAALGTAALGIGTARPAAASLAFTKSPLSTTGEALTPLKAITTYNNYYEFGTDKGDPAAYAGTLETTPWTVKIDGEVGKPADYALEDLVK